MRADGRDRSRRSQYRPVGGVGAWIARSVPCEPRGLTVSHARDPSMHREPGILNRAYTKTVKLNPAISTQERGVEKPRAPPAMHAYLFDHRASDAWLASRRSNINRGNHNESNLTSAKPGKILNR